MDKKILVGALRLMDCPNESVQNDLVELAAAFFDSKRATKGYMVKGEIFCNGEKFINDQFASPWDALAAATDDYLCGDNFAKYNDYMELVSSNYVFDLMDENELADFIIANEAKLQNKFPWEYGVLKDLYDEDAKVA